MQHAVNLYPLVGVAVIVIGFLLRFNPMLIVAASAIVTGLAAHFPIDHILAAIGSGGFKPDAVNPDDHAAIELNGWTSPGRITDTATDERE